MRFCRANIMPTHSYQDMIRELADADHAMIIAYLDENLPILWRVDYLAMPGASSNLVTISFGDEARVMSFCRYLFDHGSTEQTPVQHSVGTTAEDRVAAVWGTSRKTDGRTRDIARMRGFPKGTSSAGYDRGHFFAHTMGGGLDINLFPQAARVNRSGLWRRMENYCAANPGTFCFVRPIYADTSWRPAQVEYGVIKMEPEKAPKFWGHTFDN